MAESVIGLFDAIYTQRAIRSYKPDPAPEALIGRVFESATKAANGGNRQRWGWVVVRDPAKRAAIAEYARKGYQRMLEEERARYGPTTRRPWREVTHWDGWGNVTA